MRENYIQKFTLHLPDSKESFEAIKKQEIDFVIYHTTQIKTLSDVENSIEMNYECTDVVFLHHTFKRAPIV